MSWDAEKALDEGIETQQQRVESLRKAMEAHRGVYLDYKKWFEQADGHLQRMLELQKQRKELK